MRRALALIVLIGSSFLMPVLADQPSDQAPSELTRLELVLNRAQAAKNLGQYDQERYDEFLIQYRTSLDQAWSLSSRAPSDAAVYARIQSLLGDFNLALAALDPALKSNPRDIELRLALGEVNLQNKNYPAALVESEAVLASEPDNERALAIKHFSAGRMAGAVAVGQSPPRSAKAEIAPRSTGSRVDEAGRRAAARMNAIHFASKAMSSLRIDDPREALRYAVLAEASDPTFPDAPMQQGLAFMGLKEPGKALGRFIRAEELWRIAGDERAKQARTMKERASAEAAARPRDAASQKVSGVKDPDAVKRIRPSSFVDGLLHYATRTATPRRIDFHEVDTTDVKITDFPAVANELRKPPRDARVRIESRMGWASRGAQWLLIGRVVLLLRGELVLHDDCRWEFSGSLRAFDDYYDFNKDKRGLLGEALTSLGRKIPGKGYNVEIRGVKPISAAGSRETCP